jgi:hypothetical protein
MTCNRELSSQVRPGQGLVLIVPIPERLFFNADDVLLRDTYKKRYHMIPEFF